jgi:Leucine-rich repeat (LRR) protein
MLHQQFRPTMTKGERMKRIMVLFLFLMCFCQLAWGRLVQTDEARQAMLRYLSRDNNATWLRHDKRVFTMSQLSPLVSKNKVIGYVVELKPQGFAILSNITELAPVRFISYGGTFQDIRSHNLIRNLLLEMVTTHAKLGYAQAPAAASMSALEASSAIELDKLTSDAAPAAVSKSTRVSSGINREQLIRNEALWNASPAAPNAQVESRAQGVVTNSGSGAVAPLLSSTWGQGYPYNLYTPLVNSQATLTGCIATSQAQIMYYWKYPSAGQGSNSYSWNGQTLSADFSHAIPWSDMLNNYTGNETAAQRDAVGRLMSDVGISIDMDYGVSESGAGLNTNNFLVQFYKYSNDVTMVPETSFASIDAWFSVFVTQINNGWPVTLAISRYAASHSVVVDGYQTSGGNQVHVNMGWSGYDDAYYSLDSILKYTAIYLQIAVINIHPPNIGSNNALILQEQGLGSGTVTSSPAGINCGGSCSASFAPGTVVTLNAQAASDSVFVGWGGACSGTGACSVTMDAAKSVTAIYSNSKERDVLIALYNSTGGASWTNNTGWLGAPGTEGTWWGVTVGSGHVTSINLYNNNLKGTIPVELGNLAKLQWLNLFNNQLMGAIPAQLGNLANLGDLDLSNNQLTGAIPTQLGNLANLGQLLLSRNQLTGTIPAQLGNLANLQYLCLDRNQLTGTIPAQLGNLANLQSLFLYDNQLSGAIPAQLGNLANLSWLDLDTNHLTGAIPPQLGNLANLQYLFLYGNQLSGAIPAQLGNLAKLQYLCLDTNQLTGAIPLQLGNLANLQYLSLNNNQLTGAIPDQLGNLVNLQYLYLNNNQLTGEVPASFANLTKLIDNMGLNLRSNQLLVSDPTLLAFLNSKDGGGALFVPIVVTSSGMNGSYFTSELTLTNRDSSNVTINYTFTDALGGGAASGTASDTLLPGTQKIVPDAIAYLRSLGVPIPATGNQGGTLRASFSGSNFLPDGGVTVRTTTAVPNGRAGLAYAGVPVYAGGLQDPAYLCGLRQNSADRSNVAVQNMGTSSDGNITLRLTVYSGDPGNSTSQALPDIVLAPGRFQQISGILASNGLTLANGYVRIERINGTAPYYAYGVINDNANSDGSFIPPILESSLAGKTSMTLPVIVETGTFASELALTNWTATAKTLQCSYVASAITTANHAASFTIRLNGGEQKIIPNFVQSLRAQGVNGIGPAGTTFAGALYISIATGDLSGISVAARTSTPGGGGGYGLYYTVMPDGTTPRTDAWICGLQQNSENRTNLALVNTGETDNSADTFQIDLYDGTTGVKVGSVPPQTINAFAWSQINTILSTYASGTTAGYAHITRTSGNNPFLAYAVINDGSAPGQRSGDGAFISSTP